MLPKFLCWLYFVWPFTTILNIFIFEIFQMCVYFGHLYSFHSKYFSIVICHLIIVITSPMGCYFFVLILKFGIKHKIYALMLCYFVCQIWHMLYLVPNLTPSIAYAKIWNMLPLNISLTILFISLPFYNFNII